MVELQFSSSWKRLPTKGEIKDRVIESFQKIYMDDYQLA
jgi:hypothetical protein